MVAAKIAGIKTVPKMCSLEDKLLCACEDSYLPEKYIIIGFVIYLIAERFIPSASRDNAENIA